MFIQEYFLWLCNSSRCTSPIFSQNIHLCFSQFGFLINRLSKPRFKCKFCKQVNQDSHFLLNRKKKLNQKVLCKAHQMDKGTSLYYHWPYLTEEKIVSTAIRPALPDLPCQYKLSQQHTKINSHFPPILFSGLGVSWTCQGQNHAYAIRVLLAVMPTYHAPRSSTV